MRGEGRINYKSDRIVLYGLLELYVDEIIFRKVLLPWPKRSYDNIYATRISKEKLLQVYIPSNKETLLLGTNWWWRWIAIKYEDFNDQIKTIYFLPFSFFRWKKEQKSWLNAFQKLGIPISDKVNNK
jgi:hypothetical protein